MQFFPVPADYDGKEAKAMETTDYEKQLIALIESSTNREEAIMISLEVIRAQLELLLSEQPYPPASLPAAGGTTE